MSYSDHLIGPKHKEPLPSDRRASAKYRLRQEWHPQPQGVMDSVLEDANSLAHWALGAISKGLSALEHTYKRAQSPQTTETANTLAVPAPEATVYSFDEALARRADEEAAAAAVELNDATDRLERTARFLGRLADA